MAGDLPLSGGKQSHACDGGQGWTVLSQASVHVGSSVSGLSIRGGVLCPLLLNPFSAALVGRPALSDLGAVHTHGQRTLTSEELS